MKAIAITVKDVKRLLHGYRFYVSASLCVLVNVFLPLIKNLFKSPWERRIVFELWFIKPYYAVTLISLGFALLISISDIVSREKDKGTLTFLFALPISSFDVVFGKFLVMLSVICIFSVLNSLSFVLIVYIYNRNTEFSYFYGSTVMLSYFISIMLFQIAIGGLILFTSSIFKRSSLVPLAVIFLYLLPAVLYSKVFIDNLIANPEPVAETFHIKPFFAALYLRQYFPYIFIAIMLFGLGVLIEPSWLVYEPQVIKYLPLIVNAQRIFYKALIPEFNIGLFDLLMSGIIPLIIGIISFVLALKIIAKKE